jgi:hypothetical protein
MLCINNYTQEYIDNCRARVDAQIAAYQTLVATSKTQSVTGFDAAIKALEPHFYSNMLLALDSYFVHRARAVEKKDGNPLNEVRMLCNATINNNSILCEDKTIKYDPAKAILKYRIGDEIKLNEADFIPLASAFFAEIERKYL